MKKRKEKKPKKLGTKIKAPSIQFKKSLSLFKPCDSSPQTLLSNNFFVNGTMLYNLCHSPNHTEPFQRYQTRQKDVSLFQLALRRTWENPFFSFDLGCLFPELGPELGKLRTKNRTALVCRKILRKWREDK